MLPVVEAKPDFIGQLLRDQQELTAVERFSLSGHNRQPQLQDESTAYRPAGSFYSDDHTAYRPAQARYYQDLLPASPPGPGQQYAFEVDLDKCSGCKACVVACHTMNGLEEDEAWRRVGTVVGPVGQGHVQHVTTACHHCEDPGCLRGCPVQAYEKDPATGIVRHLDDQCIGCKYCTMMCPYEVPRYSERLGIVRKCDMCQQRLSAGEAPACVQACPNEAIAITIVKSGQATALLASGNASETRLAPGAPLSRLTTPTTRYKTGRAESYHAATPQDATLDPVADSHWPLAVMLVATEVSVGIVLAERLAAVLMMFAGQTIPADATRSAATAALLIGGLGLGLAPLHLGQPLRAWRVFLGLRTSWLSREAVLLGKYIGVLAIATALLWKSTFAPHLPTELVDAMPSATVDIALTLAGLIGLAGLYSSAMIYIATGRRLWRAERTWPRFFGSAAVGGVAWTVPILLVSPISLDHARAAAAGIAFSLAGKLLWEYWIQYAHRPAADDFDTRSCRIALGPLRGLTIARFAFGAFAVALAAVVAGLASSLSLSTALLAAGGAAILLTNGELCERLLYFSSVVYERMPGTLR